jgi:DNA polymerase-3 subunit delta
LKLNSDSLQRHLEQHLLPAYLISGDEPLLAGEAADAVRARARAAGFTEREVHFMDRGGDWQAVRASAAALSLFAARRLLEVRLPSGKPGVAGSRVLSAVAESLQEDTLLLVLTGRLDREAQGSEWVRAIDSRGAWVPIWPIGADKLLPWLGARARRLGLSIDAEALALLADRTEGNLLAARQELEKLRLLAADRHVTVEAVLASSADSARFDVAELGEALRSADAARALRVLGGLRAEAVELPLVLWATVRALHDLGGSRPLARLIARAARADGIVKGRIAGNAWDELALLAADACGCAVPPAAPQAGV